MVKWELVARINAVSVWTYNDWLLMRDESTEGSWLVENFQDVMTYVDMRSREGWKVD